MPRFPTPLATRLFSYRHPHPANVCSRRQWSTVNRCRVTRSVSLSCCSVTKPQLLPWLGRYLIHSSPEVLKAASRTRHSSLRPEPEVITRLPYLTAVCRKRCGFTDWFDLRTSDGEGTNAGGGYEFDIGTVLVPCIYLAHRRPEVYRSQGCLSQSAL